MTRDECLDILRNPFMHSAQRRREAEIQACLEIKGLEDAYNNMRDWAQKNGVDTFARNVVAESS